VATAVDLFAGIGGNTTAAKAAGIQVLWAANHNQMVVDYHKLNHPEVEHKCQDLQQADWGLVPGHDILLASPCCQGHTKARGIDGPHHHVSRSTAWAPVSCAEHHTPDIVMVENVTEMMRWKLFPQWKSCWEALGYATSFHVLDSADFGVPQHRIRMFMVGTRSKHPIDLTFEKKPHVGFDSIVNLDSGKWSLVDKPGRAQATLDRVANGRREFGPYFVMPYYKNGSGKTGRDIRRPIGTIPTRDRWAIVKGDKMRMCSVEEYRKAMSFPDDLQLPKRKDFAVHALGNATCPVEVQAVLEAIQRAA